MYKNIFDVKPSPVDADYYANGSFCKVKPGVGLMYHCIGEKVWKKSSISFEEMKNYKDFTSRFGKGTLEYQKKNNNEDKNILGNKNIFDVKPSPVDADYYANGFFYKVKPGVGLMYHCIGEKVWKKSSISFEEMKNYKDFNQRPLKKIQTNIPKSGIIVHKL